MKHVTKFLAAILILAGFISCNNDDDPTPNPNVTFLATLNGTQEAPPNASTFTGAATLTFNTTTKIFTVTVTHNVPAPTNGHIHIGAVGVSGPVVFPFATFASPISYTSAALTATQEADLNANLYYVNIHTAAFPGGEIRGQLMKQ
jgi:CHRD domain